MSQQQWYTVEQYNQKTGTDYNAIQKGRYNPNMPIPGQTSPQLGNRTIQLTNDNPETMVNNLNTYGGIVQPSQYDQSMNASVFQQRYVSPRLMTNEQIRSIPGVSGYNTAAPNNSNLTNIQVGNYNAYAGASGVVPISPRLQQGGFQLPSTNIGFSRSSTMQPQSQQQQPQQQPQQPQQQPQQSQQQQSQQSNLQAGGGNSNASYIYGDNSNAISQPFGGSNVYYGGQLQQGRGGGASMGMPLAPFGYAQNGYIGGSSAQAGLGYRPVTVPPTYGYRGPQPYYR